MTSWEEARFLFASTVHGKLVSGIAQDVQGQLKLATAVVNVRLLHGPCTNHAAAQEQG